MSRLYNGWTTSEHLLDNRVGCCITEGMAKIGDKEAALRALRENPRLKIVKPKVETMTALQASVAEPRQFDPEQARKDMGPIKRHKPAPAAKAHKATLYAPEGVCGFCDARRLHAKLAMRKSRAAMKSTEAAK